MAITVTAVAETQGLRLSPAGSRGRLEALAALGGDSEGRSTQSELSTAPPGPDPGRDLSPPGRDRPQPGPESPGRARGTAGRVPAPRRPRLPVMGLGPGAVPGAEREL